mmetsp:Transcript_4866/g.10092  ORF Transcript_4866/g.10092 Transcript_4866/m.10092 type:complete len:194 (-) Transcript_4866:295-876(-)
MALTLPSCTPSVNRHVPAIANTPCNSRNLPRTTVDWPWWELKETGKADEEILRFYQDYFRNPLYVDEKWNVYKALGNQKLSMKRALFGLFRSQKRYRQKGICSGHCATEGFVQGGILIFDRDGELHFALQQEFKELDMELLAAGVDQARRRFRQKRKASVTGSTLTSSTVSSSATVTSEEDLTTTSNSEISIM